MTKRGRTTLDLLAILRPTRLLYTYAQVQTRGAAFRFLIGITFVFGCDCSSRGAGTMNVPAPHNEKQTTTITSFSIRLTDELWLVARVSAGMLR
jgi:hypothetical protein